MPQTTNPIHIIFVITCLDVGGAELMLSQLAKNIDKNRFNVTVVSLKSAGIIAEALIKNNINIYCLNLKNSPKSLLMGAIKLTKFLRKNKPDIVHSWLYHSDILAGIIARVFTKAKVIWGIRSDNQGGEKNKRLTSFIIKTCAVLSRCIPHKILSASENAKLSHVACGYPAKKITVINNGFDTTAFKPDLKSRKLILKQIGIPNEHGIIGHVARFHPVKRHLLFLEAVDKVLDQVDNCSVILCGEGVDFNNEQLSSFLTNSKHTKKFHLLGLRNDIPLLLTAFDLFVLTSSSESFPNVLGEALASGVPCVTTDVGDASLLVQNAGTCVKDDKAETIAKAIIDILALPEEDYQKLKVEARNKIVKKYSIKAITKQYEDFYMKTVESEN